MHATMPVMELGHMARAVLLDSREKRKTESDSSIAMNGGSGGNIRVVLTLHPYQGCPRFSCSLRR
jgi:hypothetical protein